MPSTTVENYLKQLYLQQNAAADGAVAMGRLASAMGVVSGTATAMVKALADAGLVEYQPRTAIKLTLQGEKLALHVLRRHRIVELFLVEKLGLDWSEVHDEAEALEHAISERVLDRLDEMLGHPAYDPHGDPIPNRAGEVAAQPLVSLAKSAVGVEQEIARVLDQEAAFLHFAAQRGLTPRARVRVERREEAAGTVMVRTGEGTMVSLSLEAAAKFLVAPHT